MAVFVVFWLTNQAQNREKEFTYEAYQEALANNEIVNAVIQQSRAIPTGKVIFEMEDGDARTLNVSDVNKAQRELSAAGVDYVINDVPEQGIIFTTVFPTLLSVMIVMLVFLLLNRQPGALIQRR